MTGTITSPQQLWRTQFNKQLTDEMMERVLKQAVALIAKVQRRTPWRDLLGPDDRAHTVIVKTLEGTLRWDPARCDLERHFLAAIAGEISHELERATKFRSIPLDASADSEALERTTSDSLRDQRESKDEVPKEAWWSAVMEEFRKHSDGDEAVLAILDAYAHDKLTRRDVIAHTRMSSRKYHAAYQRLMRTAQKIDSDVRDLVLQAIA